MSDIQGITGSGASYYTGMDAAGYAQRINTPAQSPEYFARFHRPIVEHAFGNREDRRITVIDIACGPAFELDFVAEDTRIDMVAIDISPDILPSVQKRLGERVLTIAADSGSIPSMDHFENSADAGMIVNGMIYVPDKMLGALAWVLKPGALAVANFRNFENPHNEAFFNHYLDRGGVILERELPVTTEFGSDTFDMVVLDYNDCVDDEEKPDTAIRALGQQAYFTSTGDMSTLIDMVGLTERRHDTFDFSSPVNDHNQIDVFTMQA